MGNIISKQQQALLASDSKIGILFDEGMMNMVNAAYRSRHEEWGRAPNRLL